MCSPQHTQRGPDYATDHDKYEAFLSTTFWILKLLFNSKSPLRLHYYKHNLVRRIAVLQYLWFDLIL